MSVVGHGAGKNEGKGENMLTEYRKQKRKRWNLLNG